MSIAAFSEGVRTTVALRNSRDSVASDVLPSLTPTRTAVRSIWSSVRIGDPDGTRYPCSTCRTVGEKSRSFLRTGVALVNTMSTDPAFAAASTSAFFVKTTGSKRDADLLRQFPTQIESDSLCIVGSRIAEDRCRRAWIEADAQLSGRCERLRGRRAVGWRNARTAGQRAKREHNDVHDGATNCIHCIAAIVGGRQSGWIPAALMMPDQSSVCALMNAAN